MKLSLNLACLLVLISGMLHAQTAKPEHVLRGVVQDQSGAVIPNTVVVIRSQKGIEFSRTSTDEHGAFSFPDLTPCIVSLK